MTDTHRPLARALFAAAAPLLLAAAASADTIVVQQVNFTFGPRDVCVQLGDTVRWQWTGGNHDVTEGTDGTVDGNEAFHALLDSGNPTVEVTFDAALLAAFPRPGNVYDYFCSPHFFFDMKGTVTVVAGPGEVFCACASPATAPCGNSGQCGEGCLNSSLQGGRLRAQGSASVGADDLAFTGLSLLPNQPALLFSGNNAVAGGNGAPFGDGLRCAGQGVARLGVSTPNASGTASWGPGLGASGGWGAGDTRYFQGWYRDPSGSPCGSGFNLTNGYSVVFVP